MHHDRKARLDTLQAGRALAALSVLLFHTNITLARPKYIGVDIFPVFNIGYSGVDFFFVLSGFVIYLAHRQDMGVPGRTSQYIWKRFRRVYPPLWAVLLLIMPVFLFGQGLGKGTETSLPNVLSAFLASPWQDDSILDVEWTLRHEIVFYAIFAIAILNRTIGISVLTVWWVLSSVRWTGTFFLGSFFSPYHLLFAMGIIAAASYRKGLNAAPLASLTLGFAIFSGAWAVSYMAGYKGPGPHSTALCEWFFGLGAAFMILGAANLERSGRLSLPKPVVFIGEASYSIYLIHFTAISVGCKLALKFGASLPNFLVFALVALVALLTGVAFHVAVERPILRLMSRRPNRSVAHEVRPAIG